MRRRIGLASLLLMAFAVVASATTAELYFSNDRNGQDRVTNVREGQEIWIVVYDPDQNTDCDIRDKFTADVKLFDPKTGAYIIWNQHPDFGPGNIVGDYLEETGADTGLFVSNRAFRLGTRESFSLSEPWKHTHVVDTPSSPLTDFRWGNFGYFGNVDEASSYTKWGFSDTADQVWWIGDQIGNSLFYEGAFIELDDTAFILPSDLNGLRSDLGPADLWLIGRFENMDTLVGIVQDPNDPGDVATSMMKLLDTEAAITWSAEVYPDANEAAQITVVDPDENLSCHHVEYVPVFILVNPGSWNPANSSLVEDDATGDSPNNFCMLMRTGGIAGDDTTDLSVPSTIEVGDIRPIRWFNIYNAEKNDEGNLGAQDGRYYVQYPNAAVFDDRIDVYGSVFDTVSPNGVTAISFYAMETGADTGIFQLNLNSILEDLGFNSLRSRDVLAAYYLDPNDDDDFKLATAYIEERNHAIARFTDSNRSDADLYWIGRDSVYVEVVDANANVDACCPEQVVVHLCDPHDEDDGEFWVLDETSSNSSIFFSHQGMELLPVWDALGVGLADRVGGFQLDLDNWRLEVFNEDEIYVRYNDVTYVQNEQGMLGLGDSNTVTAYSGPRIDRVRVSNDVAFDLASIADTQVFDGDAVSMWFRDRTGQRITGYTNADCVFIEVVDADQDEDQLRRERIDGFWDGGQNWPFGPLPLNPFGCEWERVQTHPVNPLFGDTNIFNNSPDPSDRFTTDGSAKIYVLNPRNGRWAAVDLLETGVATGTFVSVICIDLTDVYTCVPTLGVLPGDTIIAVYQDPSNHSDSAWISIKVGIGGAGTPPGQASTAVFVDVHGEEVSAYTDADTVFVRVYDPSHAGVALLSGALAIEGEAFDLAAVEGETGVFQTEGLDLQLVAGDQLAATYTDPTDPTDTSSDTITIIASVLDVAEFYAGPSPFENDTTFGFVGTGVASVFSVEIYDLAGNMVWAQELANATEIVWNGSDFTGAMLANGAYIYVIMATDGTETFEGEGTVFIHR